MDTNDPLKMNTTVLAYLGDAVYEQFIREHIVRSGAPNVNRLHREATRFVKASAQAQIMRTILEELTPAEQGLVKRARNRKPTTQAKNADPLDYRWATALEALVGYLYLAGEKEKLQDIMNRAIAVIEEPFCEG